LAAKWVGKSSGGYWAVFWGAHAAKRRKEKTVKVM